MKRATVSVILPTYDRAGLIAETIDSLLAQDRRPDEILVIDDGSSDGTAELLAGYGAALRVVRQENSGKAAALNRALGMISGELVWIVDDDDIVLPSACALLAGALEADPELGFCAGRHLDFTHDPVAGAKVLRAPGYMRDSAPDQIFPDLLEGCHIFQPGLMVRRSVYAQVGPFRTDLVRSQDYEMILRIARGHRGRQLDTVVFWHREHDGARGPSGQRFAASGNAARWAEYNRRIFSELLAGLEDRALFPVAEWEATPAAERDRLARVARAVIQARQRMWSEALDAIAAASRLDPAPPRDGERLRLARATLSSLGTDNLICEPELQAKMRGLAAAGEFAAQARRIMRSSMRWQLRAAMRRKDWSALYRLGRFFLAT